MHNPLDSAQYRQRTLAIEADVRDDYFRDHTKIIHSMPFRRLKHKTQVFFAPDNDHICTRIEHVLHVASIASTICDGINKMRWDTQLIPEMAYAIGLGHDLGHAPFGHDGETALNAELKKRNPNKTFMHEINSYRVAEHLANKGQGLNLTYGVKDGIICHNGENFEENKMIPKNTPNDLEAITNRKVTPTSYEACVIKLADKIAYLGRDIEDGVKAGLLKWDDVPKRITNALGSSNSDIIGTLVDDVIQTSGKEDYIAFSPEKHALVKELGKFNYERIYLSAPLEEYTEHINLIFSTLFSYYEEIYKQYSRDFNAYQASVRELNRGFGEYLKAMDNYYRAHKTPAEDIIADYISGMTDSYALKCMKEIMLPSVIKFN